MLEMEESIGEQIDQAKVESFMDRFMEMLNGSAIMLMASIGHRTGLFDTMSKMQSATSDEIAKRAGLNERYVREWLGAMVAGEFVDYDPATQRYALPAEHAACLTRTASAGNLTVVAQFVAELGGVEDRIVDCFSKGGGVPYEDFNRFHEIMAEESGQTVVAALTEYILPLAPGLIDKLSAGIRVVDVGCGSGRAINLMAAAYPRSNFVGFDLCKETVDKAQEEAKRQKLSNVTFEQRDVSDLGADPSIRGQFDLVTAFDSIHDQAHPDLVLNGIRQILKPGGVFLMQDIAASSHVHQNVDHPIGAFLYTISCMHCMTVSLAQGGVGLGACWGEETAQQMLQKAGLRDVQLHKLPHDFINSYFISRK